MPTSCTSEKTRNRPGMRNVWAVVEGVRARQRLDTWTEEADHESAEPPRHADMPGRFCAAVSDDIPRLGSLCQP